jgi:glycosyltransferase involved in cell wall biosynthesis
MRIAINLAAVKSVGTQVYASGLIPAFARLGSEDQFAVFMSPKLDRLIGDQLPANFERRLTPVTEHVALRLLWEQAVLPIHLRRWQADVLFAPNEFAPLLCPCPTLLAVHNPNPHLQNTLQTRVQRSLSALSARVAARVVFVSHFAAAYLGSRLGVPASKRVVIYHGTDHSRWVPCARPAPVLAQYGLTAIPYILYVSQLRRFKRPETLIEAFAIWRQQPGRSDYRLVLTGEADDEPAFGQELRALAQRLGIADSTQFLGIVPAAHIPVLYQNADAFVLPTSMETFGHPYVEAMASGVPVICADTEVAREICGDAALYFPVGDARSLACALDTLVQSSGARRYELIERGRVRAQAFTWDREAIETLHLLHEVGGLYGRATGPGHPADRREESVICPPQSTRPNSGATV